MAHIIPKRLLAALGLAGLSAISLLPAAHADGRPACPLLLQGSLAHPHRLEVVRTQKLYRMQERPYVRFPTGAQLWVRAPEGTTAADLHRRLNECVKQADGTGTPLCVEGARISVDRDQGLYVVTVKHDERNAALEIQRRAERL